MTTRIDRGARRGFIVLAVVIFALLAACWLVIQLSKATLDRALDHPEHPLSDGQAKAQVLGAARQIAAIGHLQRRSAGYTLMSCKDEADPPYQGAVFMSFDLPSDAVGYYENLAKALIARGWTEGPPPSRDMPGKTLSDNGVTAIFNRNGDDLHMGTVRVYGECRDVNDHRRDTTAWTDISSELQ
ncbi:MAG: hypothetical protein JO152_15895 [Mycobacteriaceae bacterium]|nr:hypothetical protein [Mycobacteriaceae bacterium]